MYKTQEDRDTWPPLLSPELKLKIRLYTIVVHRVPKMLDLVNKEEVRTLKDTSSGLLNSIEFVRWGKYHKIAIS